MAQHGDSKVGRAILLIALAACACQFGCVQRRMLVRSNPPGALLYVDDYEIGTTPVGVNFTYYGTRKFRLVKDGYETVTEMRKISAPWYEWPVLDFISENFVPGQIRDQRCMDFQLRPQVVTPTDQLLGRAEELRRGVQAASIPAGGVPEGGVRGPAAMPPPVAAPAEIVPTPEGIGGQTIHPLPGQ